MFPFWSPDGRSLGFFDESSLKVMYVGSGTVRTLARASNPGGATWGADGTILFSSNASNPILRVPAAGGETRAVTVLEGGDVRSHRFPQFLPDGRHFLYFASGSADVRGIYVGQLDGTEVTRLLDADAARYGPPGSLLFVREGVLFAQRFDEIALRLEGDPVRLGESGSFESGTGEEIPAMSASSTGTIAFRPGAARALWQWVQVDRSGTVLAAVGSPVESTGEWQAAMSRDGSALALSVRREGNGNADIWLMNVGDGRMSRLTFDPGEDSRVVWSPNRSRVVFDSSRNGARDFYEKPADGSTAERLLLSTNTTKYLNDWSPDGRLLIYHTAPSQSGRGPQDIMALRMDGSGESFPVVQTRFNEEGAQVSPDGQWLAYESDESGRSEIYLQPFPGPGGTFQVSNDGGRLVRWRADGRELFYRSPDGQLMAVPIRVSAGGVVRSGASVALFALPADVAYFPLGDGDRFLTARPTSQGEPRPLTVILNWRGMAR
jgi:Tol biopolymer transport system component